MAKVTESATDAKSLHHSVGGRGTRYCAIDSAGSQKELCRGAMSRPPQTAAGAAGVARGPAIAGAVCGGPEGRRVEGDAPRTVPFRRSTMLEPTFVPTCAPTFVPTCAPTFMLTLPSCEHRPERENSARTRRRFTSRAICGLQGGLLACPECFYR
jgi:hypothetical protein